MDDVSREAYEKRIKYILERINPSKYGYTLRQDARNVIEHRGSSFSPYNLTDYNRDMLERYYSSMVNEGLSLPRTGVSLGITCRLVELLGKDFSVANKNDFEGLVTKIRTMKLTETTKVDYLLKLKRLDKWFNGGEEYTERTRKIKTNLQKKYMKLPKDMITPEEAQKLITSADNARDRAFIHFLWESGCRIGEAINLKMSNLEFHKGECRVNLYGKMGARRILLLECVRDLENYLLVRPDAKPNDPLFVLHGTVNKGKALNHGSVSKLLGELKKIAGVTKNVYAYLFRHSRATYLASQGLSEAQLCLIFGWVLGSKQVATYIHLSGAQVEDAYKKLYGIESVQDQEQKMIKCQICNTVTSAKNDVCLNCHNPLTIQGALKLKQQNDLLEQDRDVSQKVFAEAFRLMTQQKLSPEQAQAEAIKTLAKEQLEAKAGGTSH